MTGWPQELCGCKVEIICYFPGCEWSVEGTRDDVLLLLDLHLTAVHGQGGDAA